MLKTGMLRSMKVNKNTKVAVHKTKQNEHREAKMFGRGEGICRVG